MRRLQTIPHPPHYCCALSSVPREFPGLADVPVGVVVARAACADAVHSLDVILQVTFVRPDVAIALTSTLVVLRNPPPSSDLLEVTVAGVCVVREFVAVEATVIGIDKGRRGDVFSRANAEDSTCTVTISAHARYLGLHVALRNVGAGVLAPPPTSSLTVFVRVFQDAVVTLVILHRPWNGTVGAAYNTVADHVSVGSAATGRAHPAQMRVSISLGS